MHRIGFALVRLVALVIAAGAASQALAGGPRAAANPGQADRKPGTGMIAADVRPADETIKDGAATFYLHLLHHNDGESQIINAGSGALADFGGVARFKTLVDILKAEALTYPVGPEEKGALFVSAGDNFLAGPEFNASLTLPPNQPFYDSIAMSLFGYDACAIGNHEFDFGPNVFARFVSDFTDPVPFVSSNLDFSAVPALVALENQGRLAKSTVVTVGTQQFGIVGATTTDLPFISSPFPVVANPLLPAIQNEVDRLYFDLGINKIILISHLQGLNSEMALVPQLRRVDVVVGGGGGELLADGDELLVPGDAPFPGGGYPRTAIDLDGRTVPVVTTRGDYRYVARLVLGFDAAGEVVSYDDPISGPVRVSAVAPDAVAPDPVVQAQVTDPVAAAVAALQANVIAQSQVPLDGVTSKVRSVETNLGNLVADALLWNAYQQAPLFGVPLPDVALQNGGGIRNNSVLPPGNFTEFDTFAVLPFSNFVSVVLNIPPAQFKEIMENAVSRVGGSGNGRFAQIAGFRFTWDATGVAQQVDNAGNVLVPGTRVKEIILNDGRVIVQNGVVVPGAPSVNIATVDFLARGGDQYPFRGAPFVNVAVSYQQSLRDFVVQYLGGLITAQEYPAGGEGRITRLN